MNELIKYLDSYKPKPVYAQIAAGGVWEEAIRIDFDEEIDLSSLADRMDDPTVAFEVFYELNDGRTTFLGVRYSSDMSAVSSPIDFLGKFQDELKTAQNSSMSDIFTKFGQAFDGDPNYLLANEPSYVEIGVVDYWKSSGSLILRKQGEPSVTEQSLRGTLEQNELLTRNQKNHMSLDFACDNPQHWIAVQTSKQENTEYVTDLTLLTQLVNML